MGPILIVSLNPALDVTHYVAGVDWAGVNRPRTALVRPGGKGMNVASTLHALNVSVQLVGLAGGVTGNAIKTGAQALGIPAEFSDIGGESRRTFAVVDTRQEQTAVFNEPGPPVTQAEYDTFRSDYAARLADCTAVVLTGSLPTGLARGTYGDLIAVAAEAGVPTLLDASGPALLPGVAAGPAVVKPNLAELAEVTGRPLCASDLPAVAAAARELTQAGAGAAVVTLGSDGLLAATGTDSWQAGPPELVAGNPTGAGDAVMAALALGVALDWTWPDMLAHAVALGAATAAAPVAGEFDSAVYARLAGDFRVPRLKGL